MATAAALPSPTARITGTAGGPPACGAGSPAGACCSGTGCWSSGTRQTSSCSARRRTVAAGGSSAVGGGTDPPAAAAAAVTCSTRRLPLLLAAGSGRGSCRYGAEQGGVSAWDDGVRSLPRCGWPRIDRSQVSSTAPPQLRTPACGPPARPVEAPGSPRRPAPAPAAAGGPREGEGAGHEALSEAGARGPSPEPAELAAHGRAARPRD